MTLRIFSIDLFGSLKNPRRSCGLVSGLPSCLGDKIIPITFAKLNNRHITGEEIEQAILNGEILEDYPFDKYGPSSLIYGKTKGGKVLHIQVAFLPILGIVTVYEPDTSEWIDNKIRRKRL